MAIELNDNSDTTFLDRLSPLAPAGGAFFALAAVSRLSRAGFTSAWRPDIDDRIGLATCFGGTEH